MNLIVLSMIFDDPITADASPNGRFGGSTPTASAPGFPLHHQRLAKKSLDMEGAGLFHRALQLDFAETYPDASVPVSTAEMVKHFAECPPGR